MDLLRVVRYAHRTLGNSSTYFQNRTEPGGRIVKTEDQDENQFFKPKEPDFC